MATVGPLVLGDDGANVVAALGVILGVLVG